MDDFGGKLRQARERRGISLRQIAASTKISAAALEALERNDISKLPGGIFSRAFVRSYASEVGLDPDETVKEFLDRFNQEPPPTAEAVTAVVPEAEAEFEHKQRRAAMAVKIALISLPVLLVILYFALRARTAAQGQSDVEPAAPVNTTPGARRHPGGRSSRDAAAGHHGGRPEPRGAADLRMLGLAHRGRQEAVRARHAGGGARSAPCGARGGRGNRRCRRFRVPGQRPRRQDPRRQGTDQDAPDHPRHGIAVHSVTIDNRQSTLMDPGFRSPLIDFFKRGEVAHDVRLLAAQGALAPRAQEQMALLVLLSDDPDPEVARATAATLDALPEAAVRSFLMRHDTPVEIRQFFAGRGIEIDPADLPAVLPPIDMDEPLLDTLSDLPDLRLPICRKGPAPSRITSSYRRCPCSNG